VRASDVDHHIVKLQVRDLRNSIHASGYAVIHRVAPLLETRPTFARDARSQVCRQVGEGVFLVVAERFDIPLQGGFCVRKDREIKSLVNLAHFSDRISFKPLEALFMKMPLWNESALLKEDIVDLSVLPKRAVVQVEVVSSLKCPPPMGLAYRVTSGLKDVERIPMDV
jgi:hypothetical protein